MGEAERECMESRVTRVKEGGLVEMLEGRFVGPQRRGFGAGTFNLTGVWFRPPQPAWVALSIEMSSRAMVSGCNVLHTSLTITYLSNRQAQRND